LGVLDSGFGRLRRLGCRFLSAGDGRGFAGGLPLRSEFEHGIVDVSEKSGAKEFIRKRVGSNGHLADLVQLSIFCYKPKSPDEFFPLGR
jgi:hypothetical protein